MGSISTLAIELGSSGAIIPTLGFGIAVYPFVERESTKEAILHAIKLGYRHFDTAAVYQTESALGLAIAEALELHLIQSRRDVFVTSKLWCTDAHPHRVLPALRETLMRLGLEYLDLYLIHHPVSVKGEGYKVPFNKEDIAPMDLKSVWEAMEEAQKLGLTKHIGVSNFSIKRINDLLAFANIPPAVNQVEMSPLWQQQKLRDFCEIQGIQISAYSPLGAKGTLWGNDYVMDSEVLKEIAESRGKTVAQVCLRRVYEQGVSVLVKSFNKERTKENMEILDWELYPEDHHKISQIPQQTITCGPKLVCPSTYSTFESIEEYWD